MNSPHPHSTADLALAPVLINIERNLARVRDSDDLEYALALALNDDGGWYPSAAERAERVQQLATRNVDLHGWQVTPSPDLQGLVVEHEPLPRLTDARQTAHRLRHQRCPAGGPVASVTR